MSPPMLLHALQAEPRFDAPKAQLRRLVIRGLLSDERGWDPVKVAVAIAICVLLLHVIPVLLAWDFAKGAGRRKWVWVTSAVLVSWLVVPALWIASSRSRDAESNRTGAGP